MKKHFLAWFYLFAGIITGSLIAGLASKVPWLAWLGYSNSIGFANGAPAVIDLIIVKITLGFSMEVSIAQVFTIILAMYLLSKTRIK